MALQRQDEQRQVQASGGEFADQVAGAALLDPQADAGVFAVVGAQDLRQQAGAQARGGAEADPAPAQARDLLYLDPGVLGVGDDPPGQREQRLPGVGEGDVAARAAEQVGAQLPFQGLDLLGQRGLGDVHLLGGAGEVAGVHDGQEVGELLQLHAADPSRS